MATDTKLEVLGLEPTTLREGATGDWPSFIATIDRTPILALVIPCRRAVAGFDLVDANGEATAGWLSASKRIAASSQNGVWEALPQGWRLHGDLQALGLDRNLCEGALVVFVVSPLLSGILAYEHHRADVLSAHMQASAVPASGVLPAVAGPLLTDRALSEAVESMSKERSENAFVEWPEPS